MGRLLRYTAILMATATILMLFPPVVRASSARVDAMGGLYGFLDDEEDWFINPAFLGGVQDKVLDLTYGTGIVDSTNTVKESGGTVTTTRETLNGLIVLDWYPFLDIYPLTFVQTIPQSLILTTVLPFPEKNPAGNTFAIRYASDLFSYSAEEVSGTPATTIQSSLELPGQSITILDGWKVNQHLSLGLGYVYHPAPMAQTFRWESRNSTSLIRAIEGAIEDPQPLNSYRVGLAYRFDQKNMLDLAASLDRYTGQYTTTYTDSLSPGVVRTETSRDFSDGKGRIGFRHGLTENTSLIFSLTGQAGTDVRSGGQVLDQKNQSLELAGGFKTRTERWTLAGNVQVLGQAFEGVQNGSIPDLNGMIRTYYNLGGEYRVSKALGFRAGASVDVLRDPMVASPAPSFQTVFGLGYTLDNFVLDLAVPIFLADAQTTSDASGNPMMFTSLKYQAKFSISTRF